MTVEVVDAMVQCPSGDGQTSLRMSSIQFCMGAGVVNFGGALLDPGPPRRAAHPPPPTICETPKITARPGTISLAGGLPLADTFPVRAMREATTVVLRDAPREALAARAAGTGLPTLEGNPCGDLWFEPRP